MPCSDAVNDCVDPRTQLDRLVVEAVGGGGGELAFGPADEGVQLPPVVQAVVADDAPGGDAVVVVGGGDGQLGDDLQDHEGAVGGFEDDVDVAVEFAVDVGDLAVDAGSGGAPAAGGQGVDAGWAVEASVGGEVAAQAAVGPVQRDAEPVVLAVGRSGGLVDPQQPADEELGGERRGSRAATAPTPTARATATSEG